MEITLSKYAGFCEGVERAYNIVEKIAKDPKTRWPVFVLGSLVHNEDVVQKIDKMGIGKIEAASDLEKFLKSSTAKIGTLVITAHGIGPKIYELAKKNKTDVVDTTCPKVIRVQRLARNFFKKGYQIVIIGEKKHKEVVGIFEWAEQKAFIVESENDLRELFVNLKASEKIAVISQTTQDQDFVKKIAETIAEKYLQTEILDSICTTTHERQSEIKKLAEENEAVVVIGSPESANSKRLWDVAKRINSKSYFIQKSTGLKKQWFVGREKVAVTAGASTPKWIIDDVTEKLRCI